MAKREWPLDRKNRGELAEIISNLAKEWAGDPKAAMAGIGAVLIASTLEALVDELKENRFRSVIR